jgi:hypothetical protein
MGMLKLERRQNGAIFVAEEFGAEADELRALAARWPGSYVQWELAGVPLPALGGGRPRSSGPTWVLWRPRDAAVALPELEDPADFLALPAPAPAAPPPVPAPPQRRRRSAPPVAPRLLPRTSTHKNLTRIERSPGHRPGYLVRVTWARVTHTKFFADAIYGDPIGSLSAALAWRDSTERAIGKPHTDQPVVGASNSNTGYLGISRTRMGGRPIFQVTWRENGRPRRRVFNIDRLGESQALRAARALRAQAEAAGLR